MGVYVIARSIKFYGLCVWVNENSPIVRQAYLVFWNEGRASSMGIYQDNLYYYQGI